MTTFDVLYDISNQKSHSLDKRIDWDDVKTSSYMLQRWISMLGPGATFVENEVTNKIGVDTTSDKSLMYHALSTFAPRCKKFPKYLKVVKTTKKKKPDKELDEDAERLELTERERNLYDAMLSVGR